MRIYAETANSRMRIEYVAELAVGLDQAPQTQPFKEPVLAANALLLAAMVAREQADSALIPVRVAVRFADWNVDQLLRSTSRACEIADGGGRGAITRALFPDGLGPVVAATGAGQYAVTQQFVTRAKACTVKGADKVIGEWLPRIEAALVTLNGALQERQRLVAVSAAAFAAEESARQDHMLVIDKVANEVRALFPKDRKRVDLIFPASKSKPRAKPQASDDEDLPTPEEI